MHHVNMTIQRGSKRKGGPTVRVPDKTQMKKYLREGLTQQQIADRWLVDSGEQVSRSAIAMAIGRYELDSANPRPRYEDTMPWHVAQEHKDRYDARMLRLEARRRRGEQLTKHNKTRLTHWLKELEERDAVVAYVPDTEPGFVWVKRHDGDDDIIRRPAA